MTRKSLTLTITVDVDDPAALQAAALAGDPALEQGVDPLVPTLDDALGEAVADAFEGHALPVLRDAGVHGVALDLSDPCADAMPSPL